MVESFNFQRRCKKKVAHQASTVMNSILSLIPLAMQHLEIGQDFVEEVCEHHHLYNSAIVISLLALHKV